MKSRDQLDTSSIEITVKCRSGPAAEIRYFDKRKIDPVYTSQIAAGALVGVIQAICKVFPVSPEHILDELRRSPELRAIINQYRQET